MARVESATATGGAVTSWTSTAAGGGGGGGRSSRSRRRGIEATASESWSPPDNSGPRDRQRINVHHSGTITLKGLEGLTSKLSWAPAGGRSSSKQRWEKTPEIEDEQWPQEADASQTAEYEENGEYVQQEEEHPQDADAPEYSQDAAEYNAQEYTAPEYAPQEEAQGYDLSQVAVPDTDTGDDPGAHGVQDEWEEDEYEEEWW